MTMWQALNVSDVLKCTYMEENKEMLGELKTSSQWINNLESTIAQIGIYTSNSWC